MCHNFLSLSSNKKHVVGQVPGAAIQHYLGLCRVPARIVILLHSHSFLICYMAFKSGVVGPATIPAEFSGVE